MRAALRGMGRLVPKGRYLALRRNGSIIMSDTPDELRDLREFRYQATGAVLINGLGLGIATCMALGKPEVTSVTVIELSQDVINLVAPHIIDSRLTIIQADAYTYLPKKGTKFDVVWHDIWDTICADNLEGMKRLHRKYGKRATWQGSWCRHQCKRMKYY